VDVERRDARLERAEHALDVLVAVVEVEREVVLAGLPRRELRALAPAPEAGVAQEVREPARAALNVAPREPAIAERDHLAVGDAIGDRVVDDAEIERHRSLRSEGMGRASGRCGPPPDGRISIRKRWRQDERRVGAGPRRPRRRSGDVLLVAAVRLEIGDRDRRRASSTTRRTRRTPRSGEHGERPRHERGAVGRVESLRDTKTTSGAASARSRSSVGSSSGGAAKHSSAISSSPGASASASGNASGLATPPTSTGAPTCHAPPSPAGRAAEAQAAPSPKPLTANVTVPPRPHDPSPGSGQPGAGATSPTSACMPPGVVALPESVAQ